MAASSGPSFSPYLVRPTRQRSGDRVVGSPAERVGERAARPCTLVTDRGVERVEHQGVAWLEPVPVDEDRRTPGRDEDVLRVEVSVRRTEWHLSGRQRAIGPPPDPLRLALGDVALSPGGTEPRPQDAVADRAVVGVVEGSQHVAHDPGRGRDVDGSRAHHRGPDPDDVSRPDHLRLQHVGAEARRARRTHPLVLCHERRPLIGGERDLDERPRPGQPDAGVAQRQGSGALVRPGRSALRARTVVLAREDHERPGREKTVTSPTGQCARHAPLPPVTLFVLEEVPARRAAGNQHPPPRPVRERDVAFHDPEAAAPRETPYRGLSLAAARASGGRRGPRSPRRR